jgi:hypothetical protein
MSDFDPEFESFLENGHSIHDLLFKIKFLVKKRMEKYIHVFMRDIMYSMTTSIH